MNAVRFVCGCMVGVLALSSCSDGKAENRSAVQGPSIEIGSKEYDAGAVSEEKIANLQHTFTIKNAGLQPLRISRVQASCGCTVVEYDSVIAPGATGTIKPSVKLEGFSGAITKTVTIHSNDSAQPQLVLYIKATVEPIFQPSERYLEIGPAQSTKSLSLTTAFHTLVLDSIVFVPFRGETAPATRLDARMTSEKLGKEFSKYTITEEEFEKIKSRISRTDS